MSDDPRRITLEGVGALVVAIVSLIGVFWSGGAANQRLLTLETWQVSQVAETKDARTARDLREKEIEDSLATLKSDHGTRLTHLEDSLQQILGLLVDIKQQIADQAPKHR